MWLAETISFIWYGLKWLGAGACDFAKRIPLAGWLLIAIALLSWRLWATSDDLNAAEKAIAGYKGQVETALQANRSNLDTINKLEAANKACVGQAHMIEQLANQSLDALKASRAERNRLAAERRALLEKAYADPACAEWAAGAVCAGVSDRL